MKCNEGYPGVSICLWVLSLEVFLISESSPRLETGKASHQEDFFQPNEAVTANTSIGCWLRTRGKALQAKIKNEEPIMSASVDSKHKTHDSPPLRLATQQNSAKGA